MEERILEILTALTAIRSTSCTVRECEASRWFTEFFKAMPYFQKHPELCGARAIEDDPYGRTVPFALLRGKRADAVILSGHFDVVTTEEYGAAEDYAYRLDGHLETLLADMPLSPRQRADLESGEWLWGRGVADMKGGLAIHAALFEQYAALADRGELEGSLLFLPVPDEESYSAGMRTAIALAEELGREYGLSYKLLIDPEPNPCPDGEQTMSIGSVGKLMPVVYVQGKKAHVGRCYEGFSALNILTEIYQRTNGSLDFSDVSRGEASVPPTWAKLRDRKDIYDVSLPHRAAGYFTVLSLRATPEEILEKLRAVCREAFVCQAAKLNAEYQEFKRRNGVTRGDALCYEPCVMTFSELCDRAREKDADFEAFFASLRTALGKHVHSGDLSFPDATVELMEAVLDRSDLQYPLTVIGFAPPYYPAENSDMIAGKENRGTEAFRTISDYSFNRYGQRVRMENYFMGISDLSYSALTTPFDTRQLSGNMPLWGDAYRIDFDAISAAGVPGIIYGPVGAEYHTYAERVNKHSLLTVVPDTTRVLIEKMWAL